MMRPTLLLPLLLLCASACVDRSDPDDGADIANMAGNEVAEPRQSIIRDDVRNEMDTPLIEEEGPARLTIGFPDGGSDLDAAARAALDDFLTEAIIAGDETVRLWGHSDSRGGEAINRRAGEARARAVADYLADKGVDEDRFVIVSLGADNPVAPNANLDGSDNEEGQARNRRVDIQVGEMAGEVERVKGIEPSS